MKRIWAGLCSRCTNHHRLRPCVLAALVRYRDSVILKQCKTMRHPDGILYLSRLPHRMLQQAGSRPVTPDAVCRAGMYRVTHTGIQRQGLDRQIAQVGVKAGPS